MNSNSLENAAQLQAAGNLKAALKKYVVHLKKHPDDADVLHVVGGIEYQFGNLASATTYLRRAAEKEPNNPDFQNDLGVICLAGRKWKEAEACFQRALKLRPDYAQVRNNLGHALVGQDRLDDAVACFQEIIGKQPDFVDAHFNLAKIWQQTGMLELSASAYENAIRLRPDLVPAHCGLGQTLLALDRKEGAARSFREALRYHPAYQEAKIGLATALTESPRVQEAIVLLKDVIATEPDCKPAMLQLGRAYEISGDLREAESTYRRTLARFPASAQAWLGLSGCRRYSLSEMEEIRTLEDMIVDPSWTPEGTAAVHFALGKMYDDCGQFDDAFRNYQRGNEIKRELSSSISINDSALTDRIIDQFSQDFLRTHAELGCPSDVPIFIVGMPRSGTTLTEQIIASHPSVRGAGELSYFARIAHGLHVLFQLPGRFPESCAYLSQSHATQLIEPYLKLLRWHSETALHVTDKMPTNYRYIGLIHMLFPNAVIVHCERDPMDTCLSIYFQIFAKGHEYSYDLTAIGETYLRYKRLMAHWERVLPGRIYTSRYEDLIANPEARARELITACRLEWNDACLDYRQSRREVRTASVAQVREGIYTRSMQRWRNYEKHLAPLKAALGIPPD